MNRLPKGRAHPVLRFVLLAVTSVATATAEASLFQGEALDKAADVLSWVVMIVVPIAALWLFWLIHVLPEKIAHKRHHPQRDAIKTLCMLSLVFGGLLWPLAWLWAYTRPVSYQLAYGTDKHEDYYDEMGDKRVTPIFTAKGIALFYYDGTKAGSYMLAYPQKNAIISMEGAF